MQGYFEDCVKLVNILQGCKSRDQQYKLLVKNCGVTEDLGSAAIFEALESVFSEKGETAKLENLLSQMHYSQLLNFDYKFGITTTDSMIQSNGKCLVNLKLDLLDMNNNRKSLYVELSLD